MVPEFPVGFEPSAPYAACRSSVELGRLLAHCDRAPLHWRNGIYVGRALRLVAEIALVLPHRPAHRAALGFADPRLRPPRSAFANRDYGSRARLFAISVSAAKHELCLSGSLAAPCVGACPVTPSRYPRWMHRNFLLANAPCIPAGFPPGSKACMKTHQKRGTIPVSADTNKDREKFVKMLQTAMAEARAGLAEGGIPIGAALFTREGTLLGKGHNRRVQEGDPSAHGETDAFRRAGRQRTYRDKIMVTTLAPCWYCSGLIRQFGIGTVVVGESVNFQGGIDWLRENGIKVVELHSQECIELLAKYINKRPEVWKEDIGEA